MMKITLKPNAKSVKQRPYLLNLKYKEVCLDLDKMLATGIIKLVEESDWVSPMMVQEKKQKDEITICMDLRKMNDNCVHDPFLTLFTDEVLENLGGQEAYSLLMGSRDTTRSKSCQRTGEIQPSRLSGVVFSTL